MKGIFIDADGDTQYLLHRRGKLVAISAGFHTIGDAPDRNFRWLVYILIYIHLLMWRGYGYSTLYDGAIMPCFPNLHTLPFNSMTDQIPFQTPNEYTCPR